MSVPTASVAQALTGAPPRDVHVKCLVAKLMFARDVQALGRGAWRALG